MAEMANIEHCPTCGAAVRVVSSDEGTSHYAAEVERDDLASRLRREGDELAEARSQLRGAVEALRAAPMPERESIHKGEDWQERYSDWWHAYASEEAMERLNKTQGDS